MVKPQVLATGLLVPAVVLSNEYVRVSNVGILGRKSRPVMKELIIIKLIFFLLDLPFPPAHFKENFN